MYRFKLHVIIYFLIEKTFYHIRKTFDELNCKIRHFPQINLSSFTPRYQLSIFLSLRGANENSILFMYNDSLERRIAQPRKAAIFFVSDVIFASAPAKSISAKNHQDLYRSARHWRCIFAVYIGCRTLLTSCKLEFGITWRGGRACDSCKRVIHMGALLLASRKLKLGKPTAASFTIYVTV